MILSEYKNIINFAMENEVEAQKFYEEAAKKVENTQLAETCPEPDKKKIFLDLAAMERGHKLRMENAFVDIGFPEVW